MFNQILFEIACLVDEDFWGLCFQFTPRHHYLIWSLGEISFSNLFLRLVCNGWTWSRPESNSQQKSSTLFNQQLERDMNRYLITKIQLIKLETLHFLYSVQTLHKIILVSENKLRYTLFYTLCFCMYFFRTVIIFSTQSINFSISIRFQNEREKSAIISGYCVNICIMTHSDFQLERN